MQSRTIEIEPADVVEQGCYMHVATGLLMRIGRHDVSVMRERLAGHRAGRVVRLSSNPNTPIVLLREIARGLRYEPRF